MTLLDRAAFPRDKPCGEYLTPGAVRLLRDEMGVLPTLMARGAARLTQETVVPHRARAFSGPTDALACPRIVTDRVLRDAAEAAGCASSKASTSAAFCVKAAASAASTGLDTQTAQDRVSGRV